MAADKRLMRKLAGALPAALLALAALAGTGCSDVERHTTYHEETTTVETPNSPVGPVKHQGGGSDTVIERSEPKIVVQ